MSAPQSLWKFKLYHYWRSSSSWRVRWALAHKGVSCEFVAVNLLEDESESPEHLQRNPLGYVPAFEAAPIPSGSPLTLIESVAIIEFLEELFPEPPLLPRDSIQRAQVRQLVEVINADTQPLQNLSPQLLHSDQPEERKKWAQHWIRHGLSAYETLATQTAGSFSVGNSLSIADLCLIPQMYNARRYEVSLDAFPTLLRIESNSLALPSYALAEPEHFNPSTATPPTKNP